MRAVNADPRQLLQDKYLIMFADCRLMHAALTRPKVFILLAFVNYIYKQLKI